MSRNVKIKIFDEHPTPYFYTTDVEICNYLFDDIPPDITKVPILKYDNLYLILRDCLISKLDKSIKDDYAIFDIIMNNTWNDIIPLHKRFNSNIDLITWKLKHG